MRRIALALLTSGLLFGCGGDAVPDPPRGSGGAGGSAGSGEGGSGPSAGSGGSTGYGGSSGSGGATGTGGNSGAGGSSGSGGASGNGGSSGGSGGSAPDAGTPPAGDAGPSAPTPGAPCPKCVRIFNGMNFDGWEAAPATWSIVGGAMRGQGGTSRIAYTKADYGNVRLIVTSRMAPQNGDHLGILFWGNRPTNPSKPEVNNAGWLQWMPPFGGMWTYYPPKDANLPHMAIAKSPASATEWHTSELLLNLDKGTLRAAVNGLETTRYTHATPTERVDPMKRIIKGPLGMMKHGGGASEYKDIWVEADPTEDKLYTVK